MLEVIKEGLLKVDPGLMLWTIITFLFLLLILWKAAWKPIIKALDARAEKIRNDIDTADESRRSAEKLLAEHTAIMAGARDDVFKMLSAAKEEAEKIKAKIIEEAHQKSKANTEKAKNEIERAKEAALEDIKKEFVVISTDIASKIIKKNINVDDQKILVEEALKKFESIQ
jgi:F-type H+-transporting ATPase subunit b